MSIVETCKGCKFRKRCNGRVSKNSAYCDNLRSNIKKEKTISWFYKLHRGLEKQAIFLKYLQNKDNQK
jgi:hypothetical protein